MIHTAYNLSFEFVEELWQRIHLLVESATPSTIFGTLFQEETLIPSRERMAQIIDAAVWTSFATNEGNAVTVSVFMHPVEDGSDTFKFDKPIAFNMKNLVKLGAALVNPQADIAVWPD